MSDSESSDTPWGFYLALGGLAIVAVALLVVPGLLAPKPVATPAPSREPLDPHRVETPNGTLVFGLEDGSIVIRRTVDGVTNELGRAALPGSSLPAATDQPVNGSASFVMVCPSPGATGQDRFIFGHLEFRQGITYKGPPADGQGAPDGLFLFALRPGEISDSERINIESPGGGGIGVTGKAFAFATSDGVLQPSGCRVSD